MLKITGGVVVKQQYDRVPMADELGPVSAFVTPKQVIYRPLGGSVKEREARAKMIAVQVGGEAIVWGAKPDNPWVAVARFVGV